MGVSALSDQLTAVAVTMGERLGSDDARYSTQIDDLLAEEVGVPSGEMIGNFPQAFSHIGLINAAFAITHAQQHAARPGPAEPAGPRQA